MGLTVFGTWDHVCISCPILVFVIVVLNFHHFVTFKVGVARFLFKEQSDGIFDGGRLEKCLGGLVLVNRIMSGFLAFVGLRRGPSYG